MNRVYCNRCATELVEGNDGIPVGIPLEGEAEDGLVLDGNGVGLNDEKVKLIMGKLVFVVVDEDDETIEDMDYCVPCIKLMIQEFIESETGFETSTGDDD